MQIAERKVAELHQKITGITVEFERWLGDAEQRKPLRKHRSQLVRFTDQLSGLTGAVSAEVDAAGLDGDHALRAGRELQLRMLEVHRAWDFFRSKLNLRYVEWFRPYLGVLDEFASACYDCASHHDRREDVVPASVKAAPLVFPCGEFSPFLHARLTPFVVEQVDDAPDSLRFLQLIHELPVPVIGIPWYQLTHLPDAVLIAHEVGHDVQRSFQLTSTTTDHLRSVQARLPKERRSGWFAWLPEIFADLYGVLAAGPAFGSALIDLLAVDPDVVAAEPAAEPWLPHPPAALRIAITTQALERRFDTEALALRDTWAQAYPASETSAVAPFARDVELVVDALAAGVYRQFGERTLDEVVTFTSAEQVAATTAANVAAHGAVPPTADIRCLIAAARLAYDGDPSGFTVVPLNRAKSPQQLILDRAVSGIDDQPRSLRRGDARPQPEPSDDRAAGAALLDLITRTGRPAAPLAHDDMGGTTDDR
jgi:hypothetical protein